MERVDAELSPALSSRAAGDGGIRQLASVELTHPFPGAGPGAGGARTMKGLEEA